MDTIRLSKETKRGLIGKKIIDCGDNYIKLDNGCCIYLDESEIDNLGSEKIEREFDDHDSSLLYGIDNN